MPDTSAEAVVPDMPVITGIIKVPARYPEYHQLQRNNAFQGIFIINVGIQAAVIYIINHRDELIHQESLEGNQKNQDLYLVPQLSCKNASFLSACLFPS